ncbi:DMT family transporter [Streptomyces lavendofoliae]|uniref:Membrane protein n=1 Tax=Streptomyces lavendofoliae TaxID=67314 RepID=A0A918I086_9ACTN|nr:DMT family transporter [Streptomyces lavendofoliae]GGU45570.1 membrane protein [Streptomyces lavendofoliae]
MNRNRIRGMSLAAFACVLVGASFTANSVLGDYPHAGGQAIRYGLAFLLLLPLVGRGAATALRALTPRQWGRVALLAAVGMVGFNLAVLAAERTAEPAIPGVFVGCAPVVVAVLVPAVNGRRPTRPVLYGALLVAAGAFTVQGWGRTDLAGIAWSVGALLGEVGFAVLAVPVLKPLGPKLLSATVCCVAALESAVAGLLSDGTAMVRVPTGQESVALLWQAAVVTVVGFVCWYMGVQRIGAERATLFSGLIPVSAAMTAPLVATGSYGLAQGVGSALVGAGVALGSGVLRAPAPAVVAPVRGDGPLRADTPPDRQPVAGGRHGGEGYEGDGRPGDGRRGDARPGNVQGRDLATGGRYPARADRPGGGRSLG